MKQEISMMRNLFALVLILCLSSSGAIAAESTNAGSGAKENFEYQTVTTRDGLVFRVPEDMPIRTQNGITAPIGFDEYIYGKFKGMDGRLQSIEAKLNRLESMLSKLVGEDSGATPPAASGLLKSVPPTKAYGDKGNDET